MISWRASAVAAAAVLATVALIPTASVDAVHYDRALLRLLLHFLRHFRSTFLADGSFCGIIFFDHLSNTCLCARVSLRDDGP